MGQQWKINLIPIVQHQNKGGQLFTERRFPFLGSVRTMMIFKLSASCFWGKKFLKTYSQFEAFIFSWLLEQKDDEVLKGIIKKTRLQIISVWATQNSITSHYWPALTNYVMVPALSKPVTSSCLSVLEETVFPDTCCIYCEVHLLPCQQQTLAILVQFIIWNLRLQTNQLTQMCRNKSELFSLFWHQEELLFSTVDINMYIIII